MVSAMMRRFVLVGLSAALATLVGLSATTAATLPTLVAFIQMEGCAGRGVVAAVPGNLVAAGPELDVTWSAGGTIHITFLLAPPYEEYPDLELRRDDGVVLVRFRPEFDHTLQAAIDCGSVPASVLSVSGGRAIALPDAAMATQTPPASVQLGLAILGLAILIALRTMGMPLGNQNPRAGHG